MSGQDAELDVFRNQVNCAALLERASPAWQLNKRGSTRRALKYRRGEGEIVIVIVIHDGRGWWDPHSQAKGDVFKLIQGQVSLVLRRFVGVTQATPRACGRIRQRRLAGCGALEPPAAAAAGFGRLELPGW